MTELLVLGALQKEKRSGYDIQTMLQVSDAETWGGVLVGSIYHALNKLEKAGHIRVAAVEMTGRRQKAVYEATEAGRSYYRELLQKVLSDNAVIYPTAFYAGLNFLSDLDSGEVRRALEKQWQTIEVQKESLRLGMEEKKRCMGKDYLPVSDMVAENMSAHMQLQQDFLVRLMDLLEKQQKIS
jgi:DNA-binding PadR family transcriptional regulator